MALFISWLDAVSSEPLLLHGAVYKGLHRLGYDSVKPEQFDAVQSLLKGDDIFTSVPTSFGKSLVYMLLPFCAESLLCTCTSAWVQVSIRGSDQSDQLAETI